MAKGLGAIAPADPPSDDIVLPDVKAVNAQISETMRNEREHARGKRRPGAMAWVALVAQAEKKHPDNIFKQFTHCVRNGKMPAGTGASRNVGDDTGRKFGTDILRALNDLRRERINLPKLTSLKRKHVVTLVQRYIRLGKSPSTINGRVTALRKLLTFLGRPMEVPTRGGWKRLLRDNGIDPEVLKRSQIRAVPKAVSARGLKPQEVVDRIPPKHRLARIYLRMGWKLGMRPKECADMDPEESDRGNYVLILHGAKGGRKRSIELSNNPERRAEQRALLEEMKQLAKELNHHQGKLRDRHRNVRSALNNFYYVTSRYGITEAELEIVPYSFRHEFANQEFEEVAGLPAPVLRKATYAEYQARAEAVEAAEKHVVEQLGHSDKSKSGSYNSTVHEIGRQEKRQFAVMNLFAGNEALANAVRRAGIQEVWLVGKAATGVKLSIGESIGLALRMPSAFSPVAMQELAAAVQGIGRPVELSMCSDRPDPGLEVIFPFQRLPAAPAALPGLI